MGEAKHKATTEKTKADKAVDDGLKESFPASDAPAATQPGGGITGTEPPPLRGGTQDPAKP